MPVRNPAGAGSCPASTDDAGMLPVSVTTSSLPTILAVNLPNRLFYNRKGMEYLPPSFNGSAANVTSKGCRPASAVGSRGKP